MLVLEFLRQYTLREYTAVVLVALMGGVGVVFMLSSASGGAAASGEIKLVKRETAQAPAYSVRAVEARQQAEARREKERARILAERRHIEDIRARRAARRATVLARARAKGSPRPTVVSAPAQTSPAPTRIVNSNPAPAPRPAPAPAPKSTPKKSGAVGGGGGFDDSG